MLLDTLPGRFVQRPISLTAFVCGRDAYFEGTPAQPHARLLLSRRYPLPLLIQSGAADAAVSTGGSPPPTAKRLQRALGVDYGRRQIGLAVSTLGLAPRPLPFIRGTGYLGMMDNAQAVVDAAVMQACDGIVVGLPVTLAGSLRKRGTDSQQGRRCRNFADAVAALAHVRSLEVFVVNERGTTSEAMLAMSAMGRRGKDAQREKDSVAAAFILSSYFEAPGAAARVRPPGK